MMQNKCVWLQYESTWSEDWVKRYMFAHTHRNSHTFDELRDRATRCVNVYIVVFASTVLCVLYSVHDSIVNFCVLFGVM